MDNQTQISQEEFFKAKKPFYKKWWFYAIIAVVIIIIIIAASSSTPSDLIDLPEEEYRQNCRFFSYDDIARNPDDYEGKLAKFTGEVVQVLKDGDELQMRVNVTVDEWGLYEDTVYVFYTITNNVNVLEGDIIEMYGELRGMQEYETIFEAEISIPRIYVKFIDIKG